MENVKFGWVKNLRADVSHPWLVMVKISFNYEMKYIKLLLNFHFIKFATDLD